jgi:hypothetical protein
MAYITRPDEERHEVERRPDAALPADQAAQLEDDREDGPDADRGEERPERRRERQTPDPPTEDDGPPAMAPSANELPMTSPSAGSCRPIPTATRPATQRPLLARASPASAGPRRHALIDWTSRSDPTTPRTTRMSP